MPAEGDTITFEVISKALMQATVIVDGSPTVVQTTSVTFIPLNEGQEHISVTGSFTINTDDPDLYELGSKYAAVFTELVDDGFNPPPVV